MAVWRKSADALDVLAGRWQKPRSRLQRHPPLRFGGGSLSSAA